MEWMIDVIGALVLTTLTGSILLLVWCGIGKWLDRMGHLNIVYDFLRINSIFFCVPFAYLLFMWLDDAQDLFGGMLFLQTPALLSVATWVFCIWLVVTLISLWVAFASSAKANEQCQIGYGCTEAELACFAEVCRELDITKDLPVMHSYYVDAPCLVGLWRPQVILPTREYGERELKVIFVHELTHYKQKDLWFKWLARLITCVHWFNPLTWWNRRIVGRWSEYACDYYAYPKADSPKAYLEVLAEIAQRVDQPYGAMAALLYEDESELMRRVKRVIYYQTIKKKSAIVATAICVGMFLCNGLVVYGAAGQLAEGYVRLYEGTDVAQELDIWDDTKQQEYYEEDYNHGFVEELVVTAPSDRGDVVLIDWPVRPNILKKMATATVKAGDEILLMCSFNPMNRDIHIGIIEPDGTKRYVFGEETINYAFQVTQEGEHFIYVENSGVATVTVIGVYQIR